MPKFFNSSRGPVTASVGSSVIMFPAKQWTVVDEDLGISASLQSLMDQRILVMSRDTAPLKAAASSKPRPQVSKPVATPAAKPAKPAAKPAAPAVPAAAAPAQPPKDAAKEPPLKDIPANKTPEPAPQAPAPLKD